MLKRRMITKFTSIALLVCLAMPASGWAENAVTELQALTGAKSQLQAATLALALIGNLKVQVAQNEIVIQSLKNQIAYQATVIERLTSDKEALTHQIVFLQSSIVQLQEQLTTSTAEREFLASIVTGLEEAKRQLEQQVSEKQTLLAEALEREAAAKQQNDDYAQQILNLTREMAEASESLAGALLDYERERAESEALAATSERLSQEILQKDAEITDLKTRLSTKEVNEQMLNVSNRRLSKLVQAHEALEFAPSGTLGLLDSIKKAKSKRAEPFPIASTARISQVEDDGQVITVGNERVFMFHAMVGKQALEAMEKDIRKQLFRLTLPDHPGIYFRAERREFGDVLTIYDDANGSLIDEVPVDMRECISVHVGQAGIQVGNQRITKASEHIQRDILPAMASGRVFKHAIYPGFDDNIEFLWSTERSAALASILEYSREDAEAAEYANKHAAEEIRTQWNRVFEAVREGKACVATAPAPAATPKPTPEPTPVPEPTPSACGLYWQESQWGIACQAGIAQKTKEECEKGGATCLEDEDNPGNWIPQW